MTPAFDNLVALLKRLPGVGYRSAERIGLHLLLERPEELLPLVSALENAHQEIRACERCGNMAQESFCEICKNERRDQTKICVVERVPDLVSLERAGVYRGLYHVLGGRLSPINGIGPERLHLVSLRERIKKENTQELVLALGNDIEGEATCHYITHELLKDETPGVEEKGEKFGENVLKVSEPGKRFGDIKISRIAFGIPSGASLTYSDQVTLKSALEGRREMMR